MNPVLDTTQLVSGVAILLSFLAGYRYALRDDDKDGKKDQEAAAEPVYTDAGNTDYKMVLVVRNDLKMGKGKIGAQCGHAAVGAYEKLSKKNPVILRRWANSGSAKIAVKVDSERDMMEILGKAREKGLTTCLIHDAGRTQIAPNSKTVLAVGPGPCRDIDIVTGHLKLL